MALILVLQRVWGGAYESAMLSSYVCAYFLKTRQGDLEIPTLTCGGLINPPRQSLSNDSSTFLLYIYKKCCRNTTNIKIL